MTLLNLVRRNPESPFLSLQKEMNHLFSDFFRNDLPVTRWDDQEGFDFSPRLDLKETDKEIEVIVDLPGVSDKEVEVTVSNGILTIQGERKTEHKEDKKGYHRMERTYGSFHRSVALPVDVRTDKVSATFKNGVLNIVLPKMEDGPAAAKKIPIRTE